MGARRQGKFIPACAKRKHGLGVGLSAHKKGTFAIMRGRVLNYGIIGLFAVLLGFAIWQAQFLRFNYDFEAFFPQDDEVLDFYNFFRQQFEPDDNFVIVALPSPAGSVFDTTFLQRIDRLTHRLDSSVPYVLEAQSITTLKRPIIAAGTVLELPAVHLHNAEKLRKDSIKLASDPRVVDRLLSGDLQSVAIVLKTEKRLSLQDAYAMRDSIYTAVEEGQFKQVRYAGRSFYQSVLADKAKEEFIFYTALSAAIVFIILILLFKKFWGVFIALMSVLTSMGLFIGFLALIGRELDPMSNLFPILMIIVGISDVIHIMSKYIDEQNKGIGRKRAIQVTIREVGLATFLTSATTAIGFASLLTSNILPIRTFGATAAAGVFIAYGSIITLTPALISLFEVHNIIRTKRKRSFWDSLMQRFFWFSYRQQRAIWVGAIVFIGICILGISQVSTDTHLSNSFPRHDKVRADFQFLETDFGGVRNMEFAILPQDSLTMNNHAVLLATATLEEQLQTYPSLSSPISPATVYRTLHQASKGDNPAYYTVPDDASTFTRLQRYAARAPASAMNVLQSEDGKYGRLTMKFTDVGSDSSKALRKDITAWIGQNIDTSLVQFEITGTALLFDKNSDYVRDSMISGLGLAFLIVSLLMALLFRNWKMVVISLIPNIIPLLVSGALIGYLGIELDAATSIIFAIAFGIAVDDTIHFLSKFKLELNKGQKIVHAIRTTFRESGKAITLTTIILFFGFMILISSSYPPTFYVGLLISITLLSALIADLLLIPVLIYTFMGKDKPN